MTKCYTTFLLICFVTAISAEQGEKKSLTRSKNWDKAIAAFRETVVRVFLQADATKLTSLAVGHPIGIATVWLLFLIQASGKQEASQWDKLEEKINRNIAEKVDDNNIENLDDEFNRITYLMGKAKRNKFTKSDLNEIRAYAPNFFPQQYKSGKFTVKWADALTKYLTILAACYIDLMKQEKYDHCEWADQLRNLRPHVLTAAKKLAKSRYQGLEKKDWHGGTTIFKPYARLSFKDTASGTSYSSVALTHVKGSVLVPIKQQIADFLMDNLVDKFNALYNDSWIGEGCDTPPKIRMRDIEFSYPQSCMDKSGTCTLPCGFYGWKNRWCVSFRNHNIKDGYWETGGGGGRLTYNERVKHWKYCDYPDWDSCMNTPRVPLIEWTDEDYDKKKKEEKKKI